MIRTLLTLLVCLTVWACSTHRLRCDGPLQPINMPARLSEQPLPPGGVWP
jgi:hypothetical protein